jgi:hypothetical protein
MEGVLSLMDRSDMIARFQTELEGYQKEIAKEKKRRRASLCVERRGRFKYEGLTAWKGSASTRISMDGEPRSGTTTLKGSF